MNILRKSIVAGISAAMVASLVVGCSSGTSTGDTSSSSGDESTSADAGAGKSVGVIIWSTEDGLGAATKRTLDHAGEALGISLSYKTGDFDTQSQVTAAENFIAAGVDGLLVVPLIEDAIPKIGKLAQDAEIPFALMFRRIEDEQIKADTETNPYYLGYTVEDEEAAGEQLLGTLTDAGASNIGAEYFAPGATVVDRRQAGIEAGFASGSATKVGEVVLPQNPSANDFVEATDNLINTNASLDGIILTSGSNGGIEAAIASVEKNNAIGKVSLATFDQPANLVEGFDKGILVGVASGTFDDPLFSFIVMANYLQGNPLSDSPIGLNANYIFITTSEEANDFATYIDNPDAQIYSTEEIQQMTVAYNPAFTVADLEQLVADYSLADVKARNS